MKGALTKSYNFSLIITPKTIQSVNDVIAGLCKSVAYQIKTTDGAEYALDNIDNVLSYSNPSSRKIEKLKIKGNKEDSKSFIYSDYEVLLFDNSLYDKSAIISIRDAEEKDIVFFEQRIDELIKGARAPYWWLYKSGFYWCIGIVLYLILATIILTNTDNVDASNKVYNILILQGVCGACMAFSMYVLKKAISYFYPESCFCIGAQNEFNEKRQRLRKIVFITVILTLFLGIISSLIASKIKI